MQKQGIRAFSALMLTVPTEVSRQVRDDLAEDLGAVSLRRECHVSVKRGSVVGCGPDDDGHLRGVDVAHGKPEVGESPPRSSGL